MAPPLRTGRPGVRPPWRCRHPVKARTPSDRPAPTSANREERVEGPRRVGARGRGRTAGGGQQRPRVQRPRSTASSPPPTKLAVRTSSSPPASPRRIVDVPTAPTRPGGDGLPSNPHGPAAVQRCRRSADGVAEARIRSSVRHANRSRTVSILSGISKYAPRAIAQSVRGRWCCRHAFLAAEQHELVAVHVHMSNKCRAFEP